MSSELKNKKNQAVATLSTIRSSVYKAARVANLIRGLHVDEAMIQLTFCKIRIASNFKDLLKSCIANAENNNNMSISDLYVSQVLVGKSNTLKRFMPRGRGRSSVIEKHFSRITIIVSSR